MYISHLEGVHITGNCLYKQNLKQESLSFPQWNDSHSWEVSATCVCEKLIWQTIIIVSRFQKKNCLNIIWPIISHQHSPIKIDIIKIYKFDTLEI